MEMLLEQLEDARLVLQTGSGAWALARDLSSVSLHDLYRVEGFVLPAAKLLADAHDGADQALARILEALGRDLQEAMQIPLEKLYQEGESQLPVLVPDTESQRDEPVNQQM